MTMQPLIFVRIAFLTTAIATTLSLTDNSAQAEQPEVVLTPVAEAGRSFFLESCASCHGSDARGNGPAAASLAAAPADLTAIAIRRDGKFPAGEIGEIIDGRSMVAAHGDREMPVWGDRFTEEEGGDSMSERLVKGRIMMLMSYLKAIQK